MTAVSVNISRESFGGSKVFSTFVEPKYQLSEQSEAFIETRNKAGQLPGNSSLRGIGTLASTRECSASFVTPIQQDFRPMPKSSKNLTADAPGVSASTPQGAKTLSVKSLSRRTKAEIVSLLKQEQQKVREIQSSRKDLLCVIAAKDGVISRKDEEIGILMRSIQSRDSMNKSLSICVDSLIVSLKSMNAHCELLNDKKR